MSFLIATAGAYTISRLGEQGLADFCGLKTLRHGTDPLSWVVMHIMGATPAQDVSQFAHEQAEGARFTLLGSVNDYQVTFPKVELKREQLNFLSEYFSNLILNYQKELIESVYTQYIWDGVKIPHSAGGLRP